MSPNAEEVLKARLAEEIRQHEQWRQGYDALQAQQQQEYAARRIVLLAEIETEAELAVERLSNKGFPGGVLKVVVAGYAPRKRWWGRPYHAQIVNVRACWPIDTSTGPQRLQGYHLTSEAKVVANYLNSSYVDQHGGSWSGLHDVTSFNTTTNSHLESLINGLRLIAA